ncbi:hypothetical protein G5714_004497 [Onychostoma macrolepis]|uniref:Uncharacterized protein n=1 Tax=Onychostoma macrolepis TaxID=369639 RepID=A0A7J6D5P2_9TELE|nr:hypothetical protein G5714_004497 [Onychostoma macrolepis]
MLETEEREGRGAQGGEKTPSAESAAAVDCPEVPSTSALLPDDAIHVEEGGVGQDPHAGATSPSSVAAHAGVLPSSTRLHTVGVGGQGFLSGDPPSRRYRNRDRETGISRQPQPTTGRTLKQKFNKNKVRKLNVFKTELHAQFEAVNNDRSPVHLHDIHLQPSHLSEGVHDILYTRCLSQLDYTYNPNISSKEKDLPISEIIKINTSYYRMNVKAKRMQQKSQRPQLCSRWNLSPEYHLHRCDESIPIDLTVWNDNITTEC